MILSHKVAPLYYHLTRPWLRFSLGIKHDTNSTCEKYEQLYKLPLCFVNTSPTGGCETSKCRTRRAPGRIYTYSDSKLAVEYDNGLKTSATKELFLRTIQNLLWNHPANPMAMGPCTHSLTVIVACTCDTRHYGNNTSMISAATHATILRVAQLW